MTVFCIFFIVPVVFSQKKCVIFIESGKCKDVLAYIHRQVQNDSLRVIYFKDNYKIIDLKCEDPLQVIEYFNNNENLYCYFKHQDDFILLE
jgi:hypothetical protein